MKTLEPGLEKHVDFLIEPFRSLEVSRPELIDPFLVVAPFYEQSGKPLIAGIA